MPTQITVLGLNAVGTSIGLALSGNKEQISRVGNDHDIAIARQAERMGAFDKVVINLHSAVENAGVVVLALPVDEIEETLKQIAADLHPGTVVIDTSPLRVAVLDMAARLLGPECYLVSMAPGLNPQYLHDTAAGPDGAHADLFKKGVMVITSAPGTHAGAIQLAADLSSLLGGIPYYADPLEADGLTAASHTLPMLLSAALVHAAVDQPGWREGRKLAGPAFAHATQPVTLLDERKQLGKIALLNRENVLRVLDNLIQSLQEIRGMVDRGEEDALHEYLTTAREGRAEWLKQRQTADWDAVRSQPAPSVAETFGRLVGWHPKKK